MSNDLLVTLTTYFTIPSYFKFNLFFGFVGCHSFHLSTCHAETLELQSNSLRGSVPESLCTLSNSPVVSIDCTEVICQQGCCTCFPLANKSAASNVVNQDLTSGLVVLTNITRIIDDTSKEESGGSMSSISQSMGDDGSEESESANITNIAAADDDYYKTNKFTNESAGNAYSSQFWQSTNKPSSDSIGQLPEDDTESGSEIDYNKTFPASDNSGSESSEVLVDVNSGTDKSAYYINPKSETSNYVSKGLEVEKNSSGAESAGVQADASSPAGKYLLVFIFLIALLIVLIGAVVLASTRRRKKALVKCDANACTEKSPPVNFDDSEAEEGYDSSVANSCLQVKNESIDSSDRSSKVKDSDVVKWWLRAKR